MPSIAQITGKLADNATTVAFTPTSAANGDSTEAAWTSLTQGTSLANRPVFTHRAQWNGPKTARRHTIKLVVPDADPVTGAVLSRQIFDLTITIPSTTTDIKTKDAQAIFRSLIGQTLLIDSLTQGYAAT